MCTARPVALGELLFRFKAPGFERLMQSAYLGATFGGAEANVAAALASDATDVSVVTAVPTSALGDAAIATISPGAFNWREIFASATWLHVSGISPCLSETAAQITLDAVTAARELGLTVSCGYTSAATCGATAGSRPKSCATSSVRYTSEFRAAATVKPCSARSLRPRSRKARPTPAGTNGWR